MTYHYQDISKLINHKKRINSSMIMLKYAYSKAKPNQKGENSDLLSCIDEIACKSSQLLSLDSESETSYGSDYSDTENPSESYEMMPIERLNSTLKSICKEEIEKHNAALGKVSIGKPPRAIGGSDLVKYFN